MSSLLDEVSPFEVCLEQNRAVPTNEASVSNERCFLLFGSRYNFERPKSIIIIWPEFAPSPIVKLSSLISEIYFSWFLLPGLMSRWIRSMLWTCSTLVTSWSKVANFEEKYLSWAVEKYCLAELELSLAESFCEKAERSWGELELSWELLGKSWAELSWELERKS